MLYEMILVLLLVGSLPLSPKIHLAFVLCLGSCYVLQIWKPHQEVEGGRKGVSVFVLQLLLHEVAMGHVSEAHSSC